VGPLCAHLETDMVTKKIFLASSSELKEDRKEFEIFINRKNKDWVSQGVFIELIVWEDFLDAVAKTRLQDEYNKAIQECDIFVMLFCTKVGQYTEEEFETAFGQFKTTHKPFIFTYFKDAEISTGSANKSDLMSLWAFQEKLNALGHFYTVYKNIDELKFKFNKQLDKLATNGAFTSKVLVEQVAWQIGNRTLALWSDDYWYACTINDISGNRFFVHYDDGYKRWLTAEKIMALDYRVGDPVECRWKGLEYYYPAHIVDTEGDKIIVQYDCESSPDGPSLAEREHTNIKLLRFIKNLDTVEG
jgi:hypothetical protein